MVVIRPFRALRPKKALAAQIATHPYDVLNSEEARQLAKDNPYSYLHIDKAEIDLPKETAPYSPLVYQQAADNLAKWLENGWLIKEETPCLYLYQLTMDGRSQTGLVASTAVADYLDNSIKKHEHTLVAKEIDRIKHIDYCDANTSPIFLTYRQSETIATLINNWQETHVPLYDFESFYAVQHSVWSVTDPSVIATLVTAFEQIDALYIADGHHRTESAVKVGTKRQATYPDAPPESEFNYFLSVIFPKNELAIWDYNRVLDIPLAADFLTELASDFEITPLTTSAYQPQQAQNFGMYLAGTWYNLKIKPALVPDDVVEKLDAALLQRYIFSKRFGINDVRTDQRIDFVGGIRGIAELERLVDCGQFTIAFSLYPSTMDELLAVADANQVMPPKSTWFEPKLLSGLFLHDLESPSQAD